MFTKTFTFERHIEKLRAELRATTDAEEARDTEIDLATLLRRVRDLNLESEATI
jgi:hypothetical protein